MPPTPDVNRRPTPAPGLQFWEATSQLRTPRKCAGCCQVWGIGPGTFGPTPLGERGARGGQGAGSGGAGEAVAPRRWPHGGGPTVPVGVSAALEAGL